MAIVRQSNVTFGRWKDFRSAVNQMIVGGTYQDLVNIHAATVLEPDGFVGTQHRMHGAMYGPLGFRRFLPWHRAYLIAFERELLKVDATLSLPYWDWDNDQGQLVGFRDFLARSPGRDLGLLPGVQPTNPDQRPWFSRDSLIEDFETFSGDYYPFTRELELGPHNAGHTWVGGGMADVQDSPNDIVFWMHHAAIDRVWAKWQASNPGERAFLSDAEALLDPWEQEFSVVSIDDISSLGADSYSYEDPVRPSPAV